MIRFKFKSVFANDELGQKKSKITNGVPHNNKQT